jgi:peptide/nickel transport system ATP-binding protein
MAAIPLPQVGARRVAVKAAGELPNPIAPPPGCRFHPRCPYAVDRCRSERPALAGIAAGREVACHRATELTLTGLSAGAETRSAAAERRFALYRAAREIPQAARQDGGVTPDQLGV